MIDIKQYNNQESLASLIKNQTVYNTMPKIQLILPKKPTKEPEKIKQIDTSAKKEIKERKEPTVEVPLPEPSIIAQKEKNDSNEDVLYSIMESIAN